jgi:Major Facilitator Superfamily
MVDMSVLRSLGRSAAITVRAAHGVTTGGVRAGRFVGRSMLRARERGGGGETGMLRLLDLHAASCAGDTLVALGLAGTIFFSVPAGEARGRVALYLFVTMLPFVLLAPVVGPVLDRFRHGRRYALAVTMLGRAFLAYMISENLDGFTLFPAAFGLLVLSRAYGVARSAAVPRLLPPGLGLSEAGARASLFGTFAGLLVVPVGLFAGAVGPEWPLRLSMIAFIFGMVTALRLPPRADSDPPEAVPRLIQLPGHKGAKVLSGRLVVAALVGTVALRMLYGFLTLYLAFAIKEHDLPVDLLGWTLSEQVATVVVVAGLAAGTFLATAIGTRLRIHRPALSQALGLFLTAVAAIVAANRGTLLAVTLLCVVAAAATGLAKLANDAVIQERVDEHVRATAFAHSETLLMVAWVAGGAVGLIQFGGRWGLVTAAAFVALAAAWAVFAAAGLRREKLTGNPAGAAQPEETDVVERDATTQPRPAETAQQRPSTRQRPSSQEGSARGPSRQGPSRQGPSRQGPSSNAAPPVPPSEAGTRRMPARPPAADEPTRSTIAEDRGARRRRFRWRKRPAAEPAGVRPDETRPTPLDVTAPVSPAPDDGPMPPPGYTLYRPSGSAPTARPDSGSVDPDDPGSDPGNKDRGT